MKSRYLSIAAAVAASLAMNVAAQTAPDAGSAPPAMASESEASAPAVMPPEQAAGYGASTVSPDAMGQARGMRQQQMEMMRANPGAGPMMGRGRLDPQMQQQIQEMRRQHMQMMHSQAGAGQPMGPQGRMMAPGMMQPQPQTAGQGTGAAMGMPGGCGGMHRGMGHHGPGDMAQRKEMKQQKMEAKRKHWETMEQRLANIEELMREMVELQKTK
jgi:hypothetical protein